MKRQLSLSVVPPAARGDDALAVRPAQKEDLQAVFDLINDAYQVETGCEGPAFKKTLRLLDLAEAEELFAPDAHLAVAEQGGRIVGAISYRAVPAGVYFGPFAVSPRAQGRGVGRALMAHVEAFGRATGAANVEISVVNVRSDILPLYEKLGFVAVGTEPFPAPERCTREVHMVVLHKPLAAGGA